jgi:hypothetical protein
MGKSYRQCCKIREINRSKIFFKYPLGKKIKYLLVVCINVLSPQLSQKDMSSFMGTGGYNQKYMSQVNRVRHTEPEMPRHTSPSNPSKNTDF